MKQRFIHIADLVWWEKTLIVVVLIRSKGVQKPFASCVLTLASDF